jgi:hypothetical protein
MSDILVKIMVEVLGVLALATKQLTQGRFGKQLSAYTSFMSLNMYQRNSRKSCSERERSRPSFRGWTDSPKRKLE